jgi:hypothetical protein
MRGPRLGVIVAYLAAALTPLLLAPGVLLGRVVFYRDLAQVYVPSGAILREALGRGALPLWTDRWLNGQPFFANPVNGVLSPLRLLASWLLPEPYATTWLVVALLAVAALGAVWLAREVGLGRRTSALTGILFAAAPVVAALNEQLVVLSAAAWVPWCAAAGLRLARGGGPDLAVVGVVGAVLGGSPEGVVLAVLALLLGCASREVRQRAVLMGLVAAGVALLLTAPLWLAAMELAAHSERATGVGGQAGMWALTWRDLLAMVLPFLPFGPVEATRAAYRAGAYQRELFSVYVGAGPIVLAVLAALTATSARRRALAVGFALACLLLALGAHASLGLPLRFPAKFAFGVALPVAVGAALAVRRIAAGPLPWPRQLLGVALGGVALVVGGVALLAARELATGASLVVAGAVLALLALCARAGGRRAAVLAALVVVADPLLFHAVIPVVRVRPAPPPCPLAGVPGRVSVPELPDEPWAFRADKEPLQMNIPAGAGVTQLDYYGSLWVAASWQAINSPEGRHRSGMTARLAYGACDPGLVDAGPVGRRARLCRDPAPVPRAFVPSRVGPKCAEPPPACAEVDGTWIPTDATAGRATIVEGLPERVTIDVTADRPGWLVLLDTDYPGWVATRDGAPLAIYRAMGAWRAVQIPAGASRVVFAYRPTWRATAVVLVLLGSAALAALVWLGRRRRAGAS